MRRMGMHPSLHAGAADGARVLGIIDRESVVRRVLPGAFMCLRCCEVTGMPLYPQSVGAIHNLLSGPIRCLL